MTDYAIRISDLALTTLDKNIIYIFYILDGRQAYDKYLKSLKWFNQDN